MGELMIGLTKYFPFYNTGRLHQSLDQETPAVVYQTAVGGGALIVDKFGGTANQKSVSLRDGATQVTAEAKSESTTKTRVRAKPGQRRAAASEIERVT